MATPGSGYQFYGFDGTVNSSTSPMTVTMNSPVSEVATFTSQGPDFILASPQTQTISAGLSVTGVPEAITTVNGFNSAISLSWTNSSAWPPGLSATFAQNPTNGSTSISISTSSGTPPGAYSLDFSASGGGVSHTAALPVVVESCDWQPYEDYRLVALETGEVYGYFAAWVASNSCGGSWTNQVKNAQITAPKGRSFGPTSGASTADATPSTVTFPAFTFEDGDAGFGNYQFSFTAYWVWNGYPVLSDTPNPPAIISYPTPSISSLSQNFGLPGQTVRGVTINGTGLGAPDFDWNQYRGITSVDFSGSGVAATSFTSASVPDTDPVPPTGSSLDADIKIDAAASPGIYQLSVTAFGYTTAPVAFTVADDSPIITSVQQPTLSPGGQATIAINGDNFGGCAGNQQCPGASVAICDPGANPCDSTSHVHPVNPAISWNNTQITLQVSADSNALGPYDVQVTATGPNGTPFVPAPGGQTGSKSNRGAVSVTNQPNLSLNITSNGSTVNEGQCLYIDPTPAMPPVTAQIVSNDGSQIAGTATWQIKTTFTQKMPDGTSQPRTQTTPSSPQQLAANQGWSPTFPSIFGGQASIQWTHNGVAQTPFDFCILAQNPDWTTATSAFNKYWFSPNIAIHETNMSQFCDGAARTAAAPFCSGGANPGLPIWGKPGGYGMMQLDPPPSIDAIWNWRTAVSAGIQRLDDLAGPPRYTDESDGRAYPFWVRQVRQWKAFNSLHPSNQVAAPSDQQESANCRFTLSPAPDPTNPTTPNTGVLGAYWFGDALLMYQNAGTGSSGANWLTWKKSQGTGSWNFHKDNGVNHDIVYEFCTCTAPGSSACEHHPY
jgi:hypothetical protein